MNPEIKILLAEDELSTRNLIKYHLNKMGFANIIEAKDGEAALQQLEKEKVDLIITDWYMPRMTGLELFKAIQENENLKDIPFLLVTIESEKEKIVEAMSLGIKHYIIKPIEGEHLEQKIKGVLDAKSGTDEED